MLWCRETCHQCGLLSSMAFFCRSRRIRFTIPFLIIVILAVYFWIYTGLPDESSIGSRCIDNDSHYKKSTGPITEENISKRITIIIREFEDFDNSLAEAIGKLRNTFKDVKILVIADHVPYPPVKIKHNGTVQLLTMSSNLLQNYSSAYPLVHVDTDYVFVIPNNVEITNWTFLKSAAVHLRKRNTKAVAIPVKGSPLECLNMTVNYKEWTVTFPMHNQEDSKLHFDNCQLVKGDHGLFLETDSLRSITVPLARPFPFTFYVQANLKNWKTKIMKAARLELIKTLYTDPLASWKHKRAIADRTKAFYKNVGIKREITPNQLSQYYGCDKNSARCFDSVLNDMPQYLYEGRWTPPCCLRALRETASYVFTILKKCGVRYWLEGGSLLGAMRHKDIIPWDYDVDIGIYKEDIVKCSALANIQVESYVDEKDYLWEKAPEGDFFRVQYSETNHLHVDIYPFYSKDGIMTKDTWFKTHRQDTEFPETYLKPLGVIEFAGINASAPNNVRRFLEYKFGQGVIENPKYPNYQNPV